mmetsp:Transcript_32781/g.52771  ORF Transcript_32781/g.52771 Transcript_32781/m.52771 type:complete len:122 (-) Transcript_32781:89-454(-)
MSSMNDIRLAFRPTSPFGFGLYIGFRLQTWGLNVQEPGEEKQDVKKTHRRFVYGSTRRDGSIRRETALFPLTQSGESGIRDMSLSRISSHVQIPRTITHTKFPRIQRTWNSKCSLTPVSRV